MHFSDVERYFVVDKRKKMQSRVLRSQTLSASVIIQ